MSACAGSTTPGTTPSGTAGGGAGAPPTANAALDAVFNPSDKKGGTLRFGISSDWDSVDPGDTYYGLSWDFLRNYARQLVSFKSAPGKEGTQLVPDLATSLGKPSDGNKTWTYTLRDGLKYEDGTPITSQGHQVRRRAPARQGHLPQRPDVLQRLPRRRPEGYSVYKDKNLDNLKSIETPDDKTIVFHLNKPFAGFDYFAQLSCHVPGAAGQGHRHEVQGARGLERALQVLGLPAGQAHRARPQRPVRPGDRPRHGPQGAAGQDHRRDRPQRR